MPCGDCDHESRSPTVLSRMVWRKSGGLRLCCQGHMIVALHLAHEEAEPPHEALSDREYEIMYVLGSGDNGRLG